MTCVGIMASGVNVASGPCTDVLREPFDNLAAWKVIATNWTIVAGRNGTCARGDVGSSLQYTIAPASEADTITIGFAVRFSSLGSTGAFAELRSDAGATLHGYLHMLVSGGTGTFRLLNGASTVIVTGTAGFAAANTWYYVEAQFKLHDTAGTAILRVNGVQQGTTFTGDTKNGGTKTTYDTVRLTGFGVNTDVDDLYISMGSGCAFKGDQTVVNTGPDVLLEPFNNLTAWTGLISATVDASGRTGTCLKLATGSGTAKYSFVPNKSDTVVVGFAFRTDLIGGQARVLELRSDAGVTLQGTLYVEATNGLTWYRGNSSGAALATSATGLIAINTWYYLEAKVKLSDTVGTVDVRLNGVSVMSATGVDTMNITNDPTFDMLTLTNVAGPSPNYRYDDLYLTVGAGASFKGSITIP